MTSVIIAKTKWHGLDHLRALAITLVFFFHYFIISGGQPQWLPEIAWMGWIGVDLFFVLSGFLIAAPVLAEVKNGGTVSLRTFLIKRFFRILPAYWFTLGLYFCIPFFHEKESLPELWRFLSFTQNFALNIKTNGTFSHAWSLCVEEHFYLLFPILILVLQKTKQIKRAYWLLLALLAFTISARYYSYVHYYAPYSNKDDGWRYWYQWVYYPTYNRLDGLVAGVGLAVFHTFAGARWQRLSQYGNHWLVLSMVLVATAIWLCIDQQSFPASVFGFSIIALGFGMMVFAALCESGLLFRTPSRITSFVAAISYTWYLTHKGIIHMVLQLQEPFHLNHHIMLLLATIASLVFAYVVHVMIEKPFLRLRKQLLPPVVVPEKPRI